MSIAEQNRVTHIEERLVVLESRAPAREDGRLEELEKSVKQLKDEIQALKMRLGKKPLFGS